MISAAYAIQRLGGVARAAQLSSLGVTRHGLLRALNSGEAVRLRQGVFMSGSIAPDVLVAAAHGGALTCSRALRTQGIWVLDDDIRPHVWLGGSGRVHPHAGCECMSHFFDGSTGFGVVDVETALLHLRRCHGEVSFFAALESARRQRKLGSAALLRLRRSLPREVRWLVDFSRDDADSGLESLVRLRLHMIGIPVECQVSIPGVGVVDFRVAGVLLLEADGRENHEGASRRHRDLVRDAEASRLGYETVRLDYALIVHDWARAERAILAGLARARK